MCSAMDERCSSVVSIVVASMFEKKYDLNYWVIGFKNNLILVVSKKTDSSKYYSI